MSCEVTHTRLTSSGTSGMSRTLPRRLLAAARGDRLEALYVLALTTGMRQGELLGLRWRDLDLENARLSVRRTLAKGGGRVPAKIATAVTQRTQNHRNRRRPASTVQRARRPGLQYVDSPLRCPAAWPSAILARQLLEAQPAPPWIVRNRAASR